MENSNPIVYFKPVDEDNIEEVEVSSLFYNERGRDADKAERETTESVSYFGKRTPPGASPRPGPISARTIPPNCFSGCVRVH